MSSGPAAYLSRKEELEMSNDTSSQDSSGSQYLQEVLGDVLADALSKVAKERPQDPIQYVADYLHSLKPTPPNNEPIIEQETVQNEDYEEKEKEDPEDLEEDSITLTASDSATERQTTQSEPPPSIPSSGGTGPTELDFEASSSLNTTVIGEEPFITAAPSKRTNSLDRNNFDKKNNRRGRKS